MNILVDPSSGHCLNLGDVAMMQVTIRRLRSEWPDANIMVMTEAPELLKLYCPGTQPVDATSRSAFYRTAAVFDKLGRKLPNSFSPFLSELEAGWRQQMPDAARKLAGVRSATGSDPAAEYFRIMDKCDFSVVSGAGQITTSFRDPAILILNTLEAAIQRGIPTAIFGQGIGPIDDNNLYARARKVLPKVDVISLREALVGPPLLKALGVPADRYTVTGDDAIEMAYNERPDTLGTGLGVNLRVAWYSDIDEGFIEKLRSMLLSVAAQLKAPLLSVPISRHPEEQDQEVCDRLFDGYAAVAPPVNDTILTEGLMREIGRCRTVVTTSYHGGVFSLSQGVPIVAWIKSKYFASKLLGLANQFGVGCTVISLDEPNALDLLKEAILTTYASAETFRPQLLAAAEKQIALSKAGYERAFAKAKSAMASASGSR